LKDADIRNMVGNTRGNIRSNKVRNAVNRSRPTPVPLWLHARSSRLNMENAIALRFRQRHGGGRCVPAPFQPSLRLHFTFPLAEPLTEACR
jgi:hypothetical protein